MYTIFQHGCVPVIIADNIRLPFSEIVDWSSFSVKVREVDVRNGLLKKILRGITVESIRFKQKALQNVKHLMTYYSLCSLGEGMSSDIFFEQLHSGTNNFTATAGSLPLSLLRLV